VLESGKHLQPHLAFASVAEAYGQMFENPEKTWYRQNIPDYYACVSLANFIKLSFVITIPPSLLRLQLPISPTHARIVINYSS